MKPLLWLRQVFAELCNIATGTLRLKSKEQDLDEEIHFHLEERIKEFIRDGHSAKQSRILARKEFGNVDRCREECRDPWGNRVLTNSIQDLKFSCRSLARSKGYCLTIISTVALCIAAHTVAFTALYNLFLEPPPFRDPDQLVEIYNTLPLVSSPKAHVSIHQYLKFKEDAESFEELALWLPWTFNTGEDASATRGIGANVTPSYFRLLDIDPLLGSFFTDEDRDNGRDDLVVLTQTCWENQHGADPDIVGKQIQLSGVNYTVVAVAPRRLEAMNADTIMLRPYVWPEERASEQLHNRYRCLLYGRLKPNVSLELGAAQLNTIENNFIQTSPYRPGYEERQKKTGHKIELGAVRAVQSSHVKQSLLLLQTAAALVIALGCANVANLVLNRFNLRNAELAVRLSLGANRGALLRQLLIESLLLTCLGAVIGVGLATTSFSFLNGILSEIVREAQPISIDGSILLSALLIACLITIVSNISPLSLLAKFKLGGSGTSSTRLATRGTKARFFSNTLVVAQFISAVVVLVGASLLLRNFQKTLEVDPGFDTEHVVYFRTARNLTPADEENWAATVTNILERLRAIPGIQSVSFSENNPVQGSRGPSTVPLRGQTATTSNEAETPMAYFLGVSPSYFETMGIPIIAGRPFEESDYSGDPYQFYIIDEHFAKKYMTEGDPVGRALAFGPEDAPSESWRRIIGVAKSVRVVSLDKQDYYPTLYYLQPKVTPGLSVEIRTQLSTKATLTLAREAISEIDPSLPMYHQGSMKYFFDANLSGRKALASLVSVFAAIGLLLSAVGIYGVLSYDVTQRVREIGIRGALGASSPQIVTLFVRQGLTKAIIGLTIGIGIALVLARYTRSFLFQIEPIDLFSFILAPALLFSVSLFASWLPARRAAKLNPNESLRAD